MLSGSKIGDLPLEYPELFLTIDIGVAEAIGFDVGNEFLRQANDVIRTDIAANFVTGPTAVADAVIQTAGQGACANCR